MLPGQNRGYTENAGCANTRIRLFKAWPTDSFAGYYAGRIESMSIVVWKVLRRLPKPLLLVLCLFLLAAIARA
jgi:hypothetical protein